MSIAPFNSRGPFLAPPRTRLFGVYPALVTDVRDEDHQGRVQVKLPWIDEASGEKAKCWARLATLMAGKNRGTWFIPEKDDEVLVTFFAGDPRWPVVIGAFWNGVDTPPERMDDEGKNNIRSITSRSGHKLTFDDTQGAECVWIKTQGKHLVRLDDKSGEETITIRHDKADSEIVIDHEGKITIKAKKEVVIDAAEKLTVIAQEVDVVSPQTNFSGKISCKEIHSDKYNHADGNTQ